MEPSTTTEPKPAEATELADQDDGFLFEVAKEPQSERDVQIAAAAKRCWCYCYCTKGA